VTVFHVLSGRGRKQAVQVVNEEAKGIVTSDRTELTTGWSHGGGRSAGHIWRVISGVCRTRRGIREGRKALLSQVKRLFKLWHNLRDGKLSREEFQQAMKPVEHSVKKSLETGSSLAHEKTRHACQTY